MARIEPVNTPGCAPSVKVVLDRYLEEFGGHLGQAHTLLAHSLPAFGAFVSYSDLYRELGRVLGERKLNFYSLQLSIITKSPVATARFRKRLAELDASDASWQPDEALQQLVVFGTCIVKNQGRIADHIYQSVANELSTSQMVLLLAYTTQLVALNLFDNVMETEPEAHLQPYINPANELCLQSWS